MKQSWLLWIAQFCWAGLYCKIIRWCRFENLWKLFHKRPVKSECGLFPDWSWSSCYLVVHRKTDKRAKARHSFKQLGYITSWKGKRKSISGRGEFNRKLRLLLPRSWPRKYITSDKDWWEFSHCGDVTRREDVDSINCVWAVRCDGKLSYIK